MLVPIPKIPFSHLYLLEPSSHYPQILSPEILTPPYTYTPFSSHSGQIVPGSLSDMVFRAIRVALSFSLGLGRISESVLLHSAPHTKYWGILGRYWETQILFHWMP